MPKTYKSEYKASVSRRIVEDRRKVSELSQELGIAPEILARWVKEYINNEDWAKKYADKKKEQDLFTNKTPEEYEKELKAMEKQQEQLERENEVLRKSMRFFTERPE